MLRHGFGAFMTKVDIIKPHYSQLKGFMFFVLTKILQKKCLVWTVNKKEDYDTAIKKGCIGICSDNPQHFVLNYSSRNIGEPYDQNTDLVDYNNPVF